MDLLEVKISLLKTVRCERQEHPSNKRTYKFYHVVGLGFELNLEGSGKISLS